MKGLFWFYMLCYILPYSITLVSEDARVIRIVFNICVFPQLFLLGVEILQFYEQGFEYFQGWNLVDLFQICNFFNLHYIIVIEGKAASYEWVPFLKILLIISSFVKCLHFVNVFTEFGFFVTLLLSTL